MRHIFIPAIIMLLFTGCAHNKEATTKQTLAIKQQYHQSAPFTHIVIQGPIDVRIRQTRSQSNFTLQGDPRDLIPVQTSISNGTLRVTRNTYPKLHTNIQLTINTPMLTSIEYHGEGTIIANHLRTKLLDLNIQNNRLTQLKGQLGIHRMQLGGNGEYHIRGIRSPHLIISVRGNPSIHLGGLAMVRQIDLPEGGKLSFYWIKSQSLKIRAGNNAFIQLAGVVNRLDVELWNKAQFNGKYLRAYRAFVKTHGESKATMSAIAHQHTLANNASDIYFYHIPFMRADFMGYEGAVLDMRNLAPPDVQEYNEYNK